MKYLIIIMLFAGCSTTKNIEVESEYGEDEVERRGDTIFWKGKQLGFLLTEQENKDLVVLRLEKTYDRYSLWKKISCDSLPWGRPGHPCLVYESRISNVKYNRPGVAMEYVLQEGDKYVYEIFE